MAIFTSVMSGNFNNPATWDVGTGFPGASDSFVINAHSVTLPTGLAATTSGTAGGTSAFSRGELIIQNGAVLTLNASLALTDWNHLQIDGGGELDINGNDVTATGALSGVNKLTFVGTAENRSKVSSSVIGSGPFNRNNSGIPGIIVIDYCDFVDCGRVQIGENYYSGNRLELRHTVFVGCDEPNIGGFHHGSNDYIVSGVDIRDDRSTTSYVARIRRSDGETASGSGTKLIEKITATAGASTKIRWELVNIDRSQIVTDRLLHTSVLGRGGDLVDSLLRLSATSAAAIEEGGLDAARDTYLISDGDNPHTNASAIDYIYGGVVEATYELGYSDDGDHFIVSDTKDQGIDGTVVIESYSGTLLNALGGVSAANYYSRNCTLIGNYDADYGALCRTETGGSWGGTLTLQSNIVFSRFPGARGINIEFAGDDQVTEMDYNAWFNVSDKYHGVTSATKSPGSTIGYGGNDLDDVEPNFIDINRDLAAWALTVSGTGTTDAGVEHLLKINGYDATLKTQDSSIVVSETPRDATDWVRQGFTPRNSAYRGTAHDGGDIGALPMLPQIPPVILSTSGNTPGGTTIITTSTDVDLTFQQSVSATRGGISCADVTVTSPTTVTFTEPFDGLEIGASHSIVLTIDDGSSVPFQAPYLPILDQFVTLSVNHADINALFFLSSHPDLAVGDQIDIVGVSSPDSLAVSLAADGSLNLSDAQDFDNQIINYYIIDSSNNYERSSLQTATIDAPMAKADGVSFEPIVHTVYLDRDNVNRVKFSNRIGSVAFNNAKRMVLKLPAVSLTLDSDDSPGIIDWQQGNGDIVFTLGSLDVNPGSYKASLIVYDSVNFNGQTLAHATNNPLYLNFVGTV